MLRTPASEEGSRTVEVKGYRVQIVEPWKAGQFDPPMQEWLQLPIGDGPQHAVCPSCGSTHFGTMNARGYFLVRVCHDEKQIGCRQQYRNIVTAHMIHEIFEALNGIPRRFGMGNL